MFLSQKWKSVNANYGCPKQQLIVEKHKYNSSCSVNLYIKQNRTFLITNLSNVNTKSCLRNQTRLCIHLLILLVRYHWHVVFGDKRGRGTNIWNWRVDGFEWFWMGVLHNDIQLMLEFLNAPFLVLHFSYINDLPDDVICDIAIYAMFRLSSLTTLVLLMWKWMGLFFRKNYRLRCWGWPSLLNWIGALTLSVLLKLPLRKLEPQLVL